MASGWNALDGATDVAAVVVTIFLGYARLLQNLNRIRDAKPRSFWKAPATTPHPVNTPSPVPVPSKTSQRGGAGPDPDYDSS